MGGEFSDQRLVAVQVVEVIALRAHLVLIAVALLSRSEVVLTALLVFVVLSSTDQLADRPLAGLSIGFTLAVCHLISLPVDYTSVNPVRSLAVAPYQDGALAQVWVFVVFPLIGGALGALVYRGLFGRYKGVN